MRRADALPLAPTLSRKGRGGIPSPLAGEGEPHRLGRWEGEGNAGGLRLKSLGIGDHEVSTVPQVGWAGMTNGTLLAMAAERFDLFVTVDRNLWFQQRHSAHGIAVAVIARRASRRPTRPDAA